MDVWISGIMIITEQHVCISTHCVVHLKQVQFLFVHYTSTRLGKERRTQRCMHIHTKSSGRVSLPDTTFLERNWEKCINFHTHQQTETLNQTQLWAASRLCTHAELTSWRSKTRKPRIPILSSDPRTALPFFPSQLFVLFCFVLFRPPTFYFEKTFRMTGRISSIV